MNASAADPSKYVLKAGLLKGKQQVCSTENGKHRLAEPGTRGSLAKGSGAVEL
jgi:hypothetical protein